MKKVLLTLIITFTGYTVYSQTSLWNLNYEISFTTGETGDFISTTSFRGGAIEGRGFVSDNISIGGWFSWEVFNEKIEAATYNLDGIDITGVQVRYLNIIPLLVTGHYYFGDLDGPTPYLGLGTGAYKIEARREMGLIAIVDSNWHYGFTPEFGAFIPISYDVGLNLSVRYTYAIKTNNSINYSYLSLAIGLAFLD